jgi:hypothetical protein
MTSQKEQPLVRSCIFFFPRARQNVSSFGFRVFASKKVRCPRQGSFQNRLRLETRRPFGDQTSGARTAFVVGVVMSSSSRLAVVYVAFLLFCDGDCLLLDDFHFCRAFLFSTFYEYEFTHTISLSLPLSFGTISET